MSNTPKELPSRRDLRDARGHLGDLFAKLSEGDVATELLIDTAQSVKVQRSADLLVIKFDLNADPGALPPADDAEKVAEATPEPKGGTVPPRTDKASTNTPPYSVPN